MIIHNLALQNSLLNTFISEIRDVDIQKDSMRFRGNIERIGEILGYEMSKNLSYNPETIQTPLGNCTINLPKNDIVLCSILRAGVPLHNGLLNYFDNAGLAKDALTGSIPVAASGTFDGATGTPFTNATAAKFYDSIDNQNTQGFDTAALTDTSSTGTYSVALNLLSNQDLYSYNLITAPGLIRGFTNPATLLTTMVTTAQTRGDNLAIVDLVKYDSELNQVVSGVTDIDSSYAATYWPWL